MNQSRSIHNRKVEIVTAIRNNGSESAQNVYLEVEIRKNGKRIRTIQEIPVLSLLPRSGSTRSLPVSAGVLPEGTYQAVVRVDPDNHILEIDESNNIRQTEFKVQRPVGY